ncbi:MAG: indolepyruvate ferredoxin oxidoreductase subunit alpha [Chloroflexota bacterium]
MLKLLSGNEALALGAYDAGVQVAAAYPGTPSTEILEALAPHKDIYAEWSTNEKVALEVALGASYAGVRAMASMKQVGLNVASDLFMVITVTGINAGLVVISADDPGIHSSQNEQDNRHYARFAKVPMLEPSDSQEAYDLMAPAFDLSERFDVPTLVRTTTRISHSKSVVRVNGKRVVPPPKRFEYNVEKYVVLPVHARWRRPVMEERLVKMAEFAETFPLNQVMWGDRRLGIVTSGVAYQYAREVFPQASFLKLGLTYPLPRNLLQSFASQVQKVLVIEELDPFLEDNLRTMGIACLGKEFIPRIGELNTGIVEEGARRAGLLGVTSRTVLPVPQIPERPPVLCAGCPHTGVFHVLSVMGKRSRPIKSKGQERERDLLITGDIGCYTLATYPPLRAMDTNSCMGSSIGTALGMEKAGATKKVIAVIGDSTFLHAGIPGLVNAVYNRSKITIIIVDNCTTAMTGHQDHPGTGVTAQGREGQRVALEELARGAGVKNVQVIDAFNLKALREGVRKALASPELSVLIVRGECSVRAKKRGEPSAIDYERCDSCTICLMLGCSAIHREGERIYIESTQCVGDSCTLCRQLCPRQAIVPQSQVRKGAG